MFSNPHYIRFNQMELSKEDKQLVDALILEALKNHSDGKELIIDVLTAEEVDRRSVVTSAIELNELNNFAAKRMSLFDARLDQLFIRSFEWVENQNQVEIHLKPEDAEKLKFHLQLYSQEIPTPLDNLNVVTHIRKALAGHKGGDLIIDALSNDHVAAYNERLKLLSIRDWTKEELKKDQYDLPPSPDESFIDLIDATARKNNETIKKWMLDHEIPLVYEFGNADERFEPPGAVYPKRPRIICKQAHLDRLHEALKIESEFVDQHKDVYLSDENPKLEDHEQKIERPGSEVEEAYGHLVRKIEKLERYGNKLIEQGDPKKGNKVKLLAQNIQNNVDIFRNEENQSETTNANLNKIISEGRKEVYG